MPDNLIISSTNNSVVIASQGVQGQPNSLSIGTVTAGAVAATITGVAPSQTLNLVLPVSNLYNLYLAANYA